MQIPQGDDFAPSPTNNKVECNFQSIITADSLDWVKDNQIVNDVSNQISYTTLLRCPINQAIDETLMFKNGC